MASGSPPRGLCFSSRVARPLWQLRALRRRKQKLPSEGLGLEGPERHFCCSLLIKASHEASPEARGEDDVKRGMCLQRWEKLLVATVTGSSLTPSAISHPCCLLFPHHCLTLSYFCLLSLSFKKYKLHEGRLCLLSTCQCLEPCRAHRRQPMSLNE